MYNLGDYVKHTNLGFGFVLDIEGEEITVALVRESGTKNITTTADKLKPMTITHYPDGSIEFSVDGELIGSFGRVE